MRIRRWEGRSEVNMCSGHGEVDSGEKSGVGVSMLFSMALVAVEHGLLL